MLYYQEMCVQLMWENELKIRVLSVMMTQFWSDFKQIFLVSKTDFFWCVCFKCILMDRRVLIHYNWFKYAILTEFDFYNELKYLDKYKNYKNTVFESLSSDEILIKITSPILVV